MSGIALTNPPRPGRVAFVLTAGLTVLTSVTSGPGLFSVGLIEADTAMRLVRIEDSIRAGSPLHAVLRDSSGHGTVLHWSHLLVTPQVGMGSASRASKAAPT